ncbi:LysR substrate binding domain protein [Prevotella disiens JCM 6334 = ATCC 29426]|jgi:lysR substrate binding domain protein|uniref:Morphology and auto-aggregation control protein n=2 Tax=Prevotella disiens TaxID=28130 RepID=A0A379DXZ7_9BACT|nr:hydrogen peroxide-inducible genes activator [Prevotella disiens]ERJ78631.1 LysR substrate binding domain protein [Prevotella disiens JCM 6334 = ATCC 29426]SUB85275.1 Morphology and auto-aggregation control protein [Prevotella disiens]
MTLQQLEYVMAVYRCKHFAKAAEYCNVTQPTLSSMIQKLEDELGIKIFDRSKQPIHPTAAGQLVIERAWNILVRAKHLKEIVEEERKSITGTFNVAILPTIAPYLLPRFLPQLMNEYPEMDIRVTEMKTEDIHKALKHGDIDAAILAKLDGQDDFKMHQLYVEKFFVYVSKNDNLFNKQNIRTTDLSGEFLWLLDEGHCFRDQLVKFCHLKSAVKSKKAYNLGSIETFMRIVESGKGVTFIPELALQQFTDVQKELVRPFAHPIPTRSIVLLTQKNYIRTTQLQLIIDRIQASIPAEMLQSGKIKTL